VSQVGPFDQWPTGMGFKYFYGFVRVDDNQRWRSMARRYDMFSSNRSDRHARANGDGFPIAL
jgi:hypothetical protein